MPSYNQGAFVEQALLSVLGQGYPNLELIVMDGGSTDETIAILERYTDQIAYWVSEPDGGQAQAINRGFGRATGELLAWLNTDDMYMPGALHRVAGVLTPCEAPALVYGGCLHFREGEEKAWAYWPEPFDAERLTHFDYLVQPASFWTRALWEATGELNEALHYGMDWDWYIRASRVVAFTPLPAYLAIYRLHDKHKTGAGGEKRARELVQIVETYGDAAWAAAFRDVCETGPALKRSLQRLSRLKLYRFRTLLSLYRQHGTRRVDPALTMLYP